MNKKIIALVAHDKKKDLLVALADKYKTLLANYALIGTATTAKQIHEKTGLEIKGYNSGPLGGDLQIGALVAEGKVSVVIFLRDPMTAQPHEPDIGALLRACDVHNVALASNLGTAEIILQNLSRER